MVLWGVGWSQIPFNSTIIQYCQFWGGLYGRYIPNPIYYYCFMVVPMENMCRVPLTTRVVTGGGGTSAQKIGISHLVGVTSAHLLPVPPGDGHGC